MYKISFFIPPEHAEIVKNALFKIGAGRFNGYECCAWETLGTGQFKAMDGSKPFIGSIRELEKVQELKVEMICSDTLINQAIDTLKQAHPYEVPAYEVFKLEEF